MRSLAVTKRQTINSVLSKKARYFWHLEAGAVLARAVPASVRRASSEVFITLSRRLADTSFKWRYQDGPRREWKRPADVRLEQSQGFFIMLSRMKWKRQHMRLL